MKIKVVSLWQPWAEAMRLKLKKNETRSWWTSHRGWLGIHAAKKRFNPNDYTAEFAHGCRARNLWPDTLTYGAVVCIANLVGCEKAQRVSKLVSDEERFWGDYSDDRDIWITCPNTMVELAQPIPLRGHQGIFDWEVPEELAMRLKGQYPSRFYDMQTLDFQNLTTSKAEISG